MAGFKLRAVVSIQIFFGGEGRVLGQGEVIEAFTAERLRNALRLDASSNPRNIRWSPRAEFTHAKSKAWRMRTWEKPQEGLSSPDWKLTGSRLLSELLHSDQGRSMETAGVFQS